MKLKLGDSVVVKTGIKDPDLGISIEGWQGRISEINSKNICIDWDSETLKEMKASTIIKCEKNGWGWDQMYLFESDVISTMPRDTIKDVEVAIEKIRDKYAWVYLGEEGERIQKVLSGISRNDELSVLNAWEDYLKKELIFPFKATIKELLTRGSYLQVGDNITVHGIYEYVDDNYGVFAEVIHKKTRHDFPLADIEVSDKKSKNYQLVKDYCVWYANR
jgi:hypothetical protein